MSEQEPRPAPRDPSEKTIGELLDFMIVDDPIENEDVLRMNRYLRGYVAKLRKDAESWRLYCRKSQMAIEHVGEDIETGRREPGNDEILALPLCGRCGKPTSMPMFSGEIQPCDNCGLGVGGEPRKDNAHEID